VIGFNTFTKRCPKYLRLGLEEEKGRHPHVTLTVQDSQTEAGVEAREREVRRYLDQKAAGFLRVERGAADSSVEPSLSSSGVSSGATVQGRLVTTVPSGSLLVEGSLAEESPGSRQTGEVFPEPQIATSRDIDAILHLREMKENARVLSLMLDQGTVLTEATICKDILKESRWQMDVLPGLLEKSVDEDEISEMLATNDRLADAIEQSRKILSSNSHSNSRYMGRIN